jgi:hypothetical protein
MKHTDFFSKKCLLASAISTVLVFLSGSVIADTAGVNASGNSTSTHLNAKPPVHRHVTKQQQENITIEQLNATTGAVTLGYKGKPPFSRTSSKQKALEKVQFARFEETGISVNDKVLDTSHKLKGSRPPFNRY